MTAGRRPLTRRSRWQSRHSPWRRRSGSPCRRAACRLPMNENAARAPSTLASRPSWSITSPSRMTLSQTMTVPGRDSCIAQRQVVRVVRLVGVDEDEVERPRALGAQRRQRFQRRPDAQVDQLGQPCPFEVGARHLGVMRVEFQRHDLAARRQRARQPDRRIAAERADLEDRSGAVHPDQQVEQLALRRRHVDGRQAMRVVVGLALLRAPDRRGAGFAAM